MRRAAYGSTFQAVAGGDAQDAGVFAVGIDAVGDGGGLTAVAFEDAVDAADGLAETGALVIAACGVMVPAPDWVIQNHSAVCHATDAFVITRSGLLSRSRFRAWPAA